MANQSQQSGLRSFEMQTVIQASSMQVLFAFLNEEAIKKWWGARNVVIQPRPGGLFLVALRESLQGFQGGTPDPTNLDGLQTLAADSFL